MKVPVEIAKRGDKSDIYMFGHVVLPTLLYEKPEVILRLGQEDGLTALSELYRAYATSWGGDPVLTGAVIRRYRSSSGLVAIAIDLPRPTVVPEPHAVVMVTAPERLFVVVEKAGEDHIRRHRSETWVVMSSETEPTLPGDRFGYVCSWHPDRSHFNHGLLKLDVMTVLSRVSKIFDRTDVWEVCASVPTEITPIHVMHRPLPEDAVRELQASVNDIVSWASTAKDKINAATQLTQLIRTYRKKYGDWSAEITLHHRDIVRLYLEAGEYDHAQSVASQWVRFCHRYRGNRAPETRIAYTWTARAYAADVTMAPDEAQRRVDAQLRVRNAMSQSFDTSLPGADDPDVHCPTV